MSLKKYKRLVHISMFSVFGLASLRSLEILANRVDHRLTLEGEGQRKGHLGRNPSLCMIIADVSASIIKNANASVINRLLQ